MYATRTCSTRSFTGSLSFASLVVDEESNPVEPSLSFLLFTRSASDLLTAVSMNKVVGETECSKNKC